MWRNSTWLFAAVTSLSTACGFADKTVAPQPAPPVPVAPSPVVTRLEMVMDSRSVFVGMELWGVVKAYDERNRPVSSEAVTVASSNAFVVEVDGANTVNVYYSGMSAPVRERRQRVKLVGAGTAVLRISLGAVSDSVIIPVRALPLASQALVVDTFTVIEYRAVCALGCPYLVYAPLLRLREPTGNSYADVVAVEFTAPTRTTGWCSGQQRFMNGGSAHLNGIDQYLWANDLIFVSLDGTPLPEGPARARVIVRDADGAYGMLDVTAPIQRMVPNAATILPGPTGLGWGCSTS